MSEKQDIRTAPRDGTLIVVGCRHMGEYVMRWDEHFVNGFVKNYPGCWVAPDESFSWDESQGAGPEWWREYR